MWTGRLYYYKYPNWRSERRKNRIWIKKHREIRDTLKRSDIHVVRHPKEKEHNAEVIFEEIMVGILFLNSCIQRGMWNSSKININL